MILSPHSLELIVKGGLGTATGLVLLSQGAQLALLYAPFEASREEEVLQATYGSDRENISTYECDITSETSVGNAFGKISSYAASVGVFPSILINAAGYVSVAPLEESSAEEAMKTLTANLLGPFIVSNAFAKLYWACSETNKQAVKPGRIVSISSQAGKWSYLSCIFPGHPHIPSEIVLFLSRGTTIGYFRQSNC